MMVELCGTIPDGVVAFFTSYSYMESIISEWDGMGIMRQLTKSKLVFIETKDVVETTMALDNFRRACDSGRGAVFLSVARGKVSLFSSLLLLNIRPILLSHGFYHSYRL
jgi:DNA excision repair protein ERCC-2